MSACSLYYIMDTLYVLLDYKYCMSLHASHFPAGNEGLF